MAVLRGEIYFVSLDPIVGHELGGGKSRPVAVLSINDINNKPLVVTVVPGTSAGTKPVNYKNVVVVPPASENGLRVDTVFLCHQLRAIDKSRITLPSIGRLSNEHLQKIEDATRYCLGLF